MLLCVVVFSSRNPPPNRLSSRPLNRLLPKFKNEEHSPPVDDDFDAIGNTIAPRAPRLLRLKAAARPPEEKKALKLSLVLHKRDEQKVPALIVLLINTLCYALCEAMRKRKKERKAFCVELGLETLNTKLADFFL